MKNVLIVRLTCCATIALNGNDPHRIIVALEVKDSCFIERCESLQEGFADMAQAYEALLALTSTT